MATRSPAGRVNPGSDLPSPPDAWRNRIIGSGEEVPDQLLANPRNWRIHPRPQQEALAGVLSRVGWVQQVTVNRRTGHVVDGHLRVELAISRGEPTVPVTYVDLSEEEEALVLASLDPVTLMAGRDDAKFRELIAEASASFGDLDEILKSIVADPLTYEERMAEWGGMPEYESADVSGYKQVIVHFATPEDYAAFQTAIAQPLTPTARSLWYPAQPYSLERDRARYVDEPEAEA